MTATLKSARQQWRRERRIHAGAERELGRLLSEARQKADPIVKGVVYAEFVNLAMRLHETEQALRETHDLLDEMGHNYVRGHGLKIVAHYVGKILSNVQVHQQRAWERAATYASNEQELKTALGAGGLQNKAAS